MHVQQLDNNTATGCPANTITAYHMFVVSLLGVVADQGVSRTTCLGLLDGISFVKVHIMLQRDRHRRDAACYSLVQNHRRCAAQHHGATLTEA